MRCHSVALIALALAGCQTCPPEKLPEVVKVPVVQYVGVPDTLTEPCPIKKADARTVEAVVSAYNANVTALEGCNADKAAIRGLKP